MSSKEVQVKSKVHNKTKQLIHHLQRNSGPWSPGFDLRIALDHVSKADHVLIGVMEQAAMDVKMCLYVSLLLKPIACD
jgi:hypothetical protein